MDGGRGTSCGAVMVFAKRSQSQDQRSKGTREAQRSAEDAEREPKQMESRWGAAWADCSDARAKGQGRG
jgi:hypothetical protein